MNAGWICGLIWGMWSYIGRGERIRTSDILLPKQARYQAALRPAKYRTVRYHCIDVYASVKSNCPKKNLGAIILTPSYLKINLLHFIWRMNILCISGFMGQVSPWKCLEKTVRIHLLSLRDMRIQRNSGLRAFGLQEGN